MKSNTANFSCKAIASAMLLILSMAAVAPAQDQDPSTTAPEGLIQWQRQASFGMVGLTLNQTARLNVAWVSTGCPLNPRILAANLVPQVPVHLLFLDRRGTPIARQTVQLSPGQAGSLNLTGAAIPAGQFRGPRTSIRALALLPAAPSGLVRLCLASAGVPPPADPVPEPRDETAIGTIPVTPGVVPVIRPYLAPYPFFPQFDSVFQLTVEIFDSATGETKLILENPSLIGGITWPLANAAPDGPTGVISDTPPPAP